MCWKSGCGARTAWGWRRPVSTFCRRGRIWTCWAGGMKRTSSTTRLGGWAGGASPPGPPEDIFAPKMGPGGWTQDYIATARRVILTEADALGWLAGGQGPEFAEAVDRIVAVQGRVSVSSMREWVP